jgi:hypothetical protein
VKLGSKTINVTLKDVVFDAAKGNFPHPNTMTCSLLAGDKVLLEQGVLLGGWWIYRVERLYASEEESAKVPVQHDERTAAARGAGAWCGGV